MNILNVNAHAKSPSYMSLWKYDKKSNNAELEGTAKLENITCKEIYNILHQEEVNKIVLEGHKHLKGKAPWWVINKLERERHKWEDMAELLDVQVELIETTDWKEYMFGKGNKFRKDFLVEPCKKYGIKIDNKTNKELEIIAFGLYTIETMSNQTELVWSN